MSARLAEAPKGVDALSVWDVPTFLLHPHSSNCTNGLEHPGRVQGAEHSVPEQKQLLAAGSPSLLGELWLDTSLLAVQLVSLQAFGSFIHACGHEPNYSTQHGAKSPESASASSVSNSLSAAVAKGRIAKVGRG